MTPTPNTYRYITVGILRMKTLAYIVEVSPSMTVYYRRVLFGKTFTRWGGRACCKIVDVLSEMPDTQSIAHAVNVAGQPPEVAA